MVHTHHTPSWYSTSAHRDAPRGMLDGTRRADICIIGAGIAGLSAAKLAEKGYKVTALEAGQIDGGASGRSGGQSIFGYGCDQQVLEKQLGLDAARALWDYALEGVELVRERIARYQRTPALVLAMS